MKNVNIYLIKYVDLLKYKYCRQGHISASKLLWKIMIYVYFPTTYGGWNKLFADPFLNMLLFLINQGLSLMFVIHMLSHLSI